MSDFVDHPVFRFVISTFDGLAESKCIRRTVALDDRAFQTQQTGAVITTMIQTFLETAQHW